MSATAIANRPIAPRAALKARGPAEDPFPGVATTEPKAIALDIPGQVANYATRIRAEAEAARLDGNAERLEAAKQQMGQLESRFLSTYKPYQRAKGQAELADPRLLMFVLVGFMAAVGAVSSPMGRIGQLICGTGGGRIFFLAGVLPELVGWTVGGIQGGRSQRMKDAADRYFSVG